MQTFLSNSFPFLFIAVKKSLFFAKKKSMASWTYEALGSVPTIDLEQKFD